MECPPLLIDGNARPLVSAEKPGFFAGIKLGRSARKIEETLDALQAELPDLIARVSAWYQRVMGFRWSQAEILLIMSWRKIVTRLSRAEADIKSSRPSPSRSAA